MIKFGHLPGGIGGADPRAHRSEDLTSFLVRCAASVRAKYRLDARGFTSPNIIRDIFTAPMMSIHCLATNRY
jgi:hypothetical protein